MREKIILSLFLVFVLFLSVSSIHAGELNLTDSSDISLSDDASFDIADDLEAVDTDELDSDDAQTVQNQTELTEMSSNVYYKGSYNVVLKDSNTSFALANKTVSFAVDNTTYTAVTDENGIACFNLTLNPGSYVMTVAFAGDDTHTTSNMTSPFKILPTVKASAVSKYYKGSKKYTATFLTSQGKALANTKVTITVNGKSYTKKTNSKGVVSMDVNLKPGTYKITSKDPITGYSITTTFKILTTIVASDLKKVIGDSKKFGVKFYKSNGKALAGKYVKIKINGKVYKYKTNSNGKVFLTFNSYKKGTYKVISYNTDGLSKTNTVKLYKIATTKLSTSFYTFLINDTKQIKVKFTSSIGDNSQKAIKIKINGKTYTKKTGADGIAYLKLPSIKKGLYTVGYSYAGNKFFKSAKTSNLLTVLDKTDAQFTVKSTTRFGYGAGTPLKVALTADGVPLVKRTVTFTISNSRYDVSTDNNGIAQIPIDLNIGNHTIYYKSYDQYKVNGTSGSCEITVFERAEPTVTLTCKETYKDNSQSFKVLVKGSDGKPISGKTVELTIDGVTYSAKTSSSGYASFKTSVPIGKYTVKATFLGNNDYAPKSVSKSTTVVLSKYKKGLNEKTSASAYSSSYLKSTRNCYVNNAKIKTLVKSLTSDLSDKVDKAKAIFNYVRDNVVYSYYYDSKKGSTGALNSKSANCVDQAHLLIAMYRAAGFKARYVHGSCRFSDGVYGHVWTQVLIGNEWVVGDPINANNDLGKIKNWNTNTFSLKSRYLSLPF